MRPIGDNLQSIFKKSIVEPSRIRTCNLLIRSQARYPLRHRPLILVAFFLSVILLTFSQLIAKYRSWIRFNHLKMPRRNWLPEMADF